MANPINASTPASQPPPDALPAVNASLIDKPAEEVLAYAFGQYWPSIILACSFGAEDVVLLDMMMRLNPEAQLFYLDTDFLFPETYEVRDRLIAKYRLRPEQIIRVKPQLTPEEQARQYGDALWAREPDLCCRLRKVEPLEQMLKPYAAWITGIRREQSPTRANAALIEWDRQFHLVKVNPLAYWSWHDVWTYIKAHDVPYNVLHDRNYPSIGCTHCTAPVAPGDDPRSGRWKHFAKTECGLHR
ncbi:MAG: phosphoadenylyl-sulfate reductase [Nitrospirae bacterium]|nr:MAG: phosphoadenylyl-sulfate reductase [Nitrospirota bacterium]